MKIIDQWTDVDGRVHQLLVDLPGIASFAHEVVGLGWRDFGPQAVATRHGALLAMLRRLEWVLIDGPQLNCPTCGFSQTFGHRKGCDLDRLLNGPKEPAS